MRLGGLGVASALAAVGTLDDGLDLLLDTLRLRVVQVLEAAWLGLGSGLGSGLGLGVWVRGLWAAGAVGGRIGAGRHHSATESRSARASVSKVRRLDGVVRT